mmetsp:Transcript_9429/g.17183  ORF Transcript_9429/g.17183 Transcript_9429/m.17183 type:complete len:227 (+) Transcript_9429:75-755(+)
MISPPTSSRVPLPRRGKVHPYGPTAVLGVRQPYSTRDWLTGSAAETACSATTDRLTPRQISGEKLDGQEASMGLKLLLPRRLCPVHRGVRALEALLQVMVTTVVNGSAVQAEQFPEDLRIPLPRGRSQILPRQPGCRALRHKTRPRLLQLQLQPPLAHRPRDPLVRSSARRLSRAASGGPPGPVRRTCCVRWDACRRQRHGLRAEATARLRPRRATQARATAGIAA